VLSSQRVRLKPVWRLLIFLPSIIPAAAIYSVWFGFVDPSSGWLNRLIMMPLGLPPIVQGNGGVPFLTTIMALWSIGPGFLIIYGAMLGVPKDLYDAAHVDGAGPLMSFLNVTLPMISPAIFFSLVISMTNAFGGVVLLDRGLPLAQSQSPMESYISYQMFGLGRLGYASALAWVMFLLVMMVVVALFRSARNWVYFPEEQDNDEI